MGPTVRLVQLWVNVRSSVWFLPALIVLGAIGLAVGLIAAEPLVADDLLERWPRFFGAGAEGSRSLLAAVATSMITVAGVVFSITVVAITLAASQYSSRVLRNFMRDKSNQAVLGVFVGIFAYCLIVVRTIRDGGEEAFVPSLAVLGGLLLALVGVAVLIFFIHHITLSIQAAQILAAVCGDTLDAIDTLFPGPGQSSAEDDDIGFSPGGEWHPVTVERSGYIQAFDMNCLVKLAEERQTVIRLERGVGDFLIEGLPALSIKACAAPDDKSVELLRQAIAVDRQRTVEQDPGFGIRQIVDIALKALSPGINDTTTAAMCLDYLTVILLRLGQRQVTCLYRDEAGVSRVLARGPTFESLLGESLDQIRQNADGNAVILGRLIRCLETLAANITGKRRQAVLQEQALAIGEAISRTISAPLDRQRLGVLSSKLRARLGGVAGKSGCGRPSKSRWHRRRGRAFP